jgi:hypothetical protein
LDAVYPRNLESFARCFTPGCPLPSKQAPSGVQKEAPEISNIAGHFPRRYTAQTGRLRLEPEDGIIWVYGEDDDDGVLAFTDEGIDEVQLILKEYRRHKPPRS